MRILKHGILYSGEKYTFDCGECGCRFIVNVKDAYSITTISSNNKSICWNFKFKCPECNTYINHTVYKEREKESLDKYYNGAL